MLGSGFMKKILSKILVTLIVGVLLQSCTTSPSVEVQKSLIADGTIKVGMNLSEVDQLFGSADTWVNWPLSTTEKYLYFIPSNETAFSAEVIPGSKKSNRCPLTCYNAVRMENYKVTKIWDDPITMLNHYRNLATEPRDKMNLMNLKKTIISENSIAASTPSTSSATSVPTKISFSIDDKKKQCEVIGFAPATEKFADCVLRLVELDVKNQQANQIALAQSQGNQQVVTQLQNQQNDQSSQAFIDLGLKLLSPQSTASSPSTSSCTVIGSGAYKTVNCW